MCPHCAVALVYHNAGKALRCHYCGFSASIPDECPSCRSRKIKYFGTGTQKAEEAIQALGEEISVLRMDQDSTARKFAHEEILRDFASGKYNVLLGTQMVAKGHDIANVTLVGILAADSQLNLPDFRAGERTFNLLTQAAGRAGVRRVGVQCAFLRAPDADELDGDGAAVFVQPADGARQLAGRSGHGSRAHHSDTYPRADCAGKCGGDGVQLHCAAGGVLYRAHNLRQRRSSQGYERRRIGGGQRSEEGQGR